MLHIHPDFEVMIAEQRLRDDIDQISRLRLKREKTAVATTPSRFLAVFDAAVVRASGPSSRRHAEREDGRATPA
jgi:hypothetical protein